MKNLGEVAYITWMSYGVIFDKINESTDSLILYISVPFSSYYRDVNNTEMAGEFLAKRFKATMTDMGIKRLTVKYKIRNEHWTKERSDAAEVCARQNIYGSQW